MRRALGGIHKQVSVRLNIKFTLSGGCGLKLLHSQELLLLALLLVLLDIYGYNKNRIEMLSFRQYRACVIDSLGLGITCLISLYNVYNTIKM